MSRTLLVLTAVALLGCPSKRTDATAEPDANAHPDPEDFRPAEEEPADHPAPAAVVDPYAGMSEEERTDQAKTLYGEAEALSKTKDWDAAEKKYEEAYYLLPGKHGFAFKIGEAAFNAGHCEKAEQYLAHFKTYADPKDQASRLKAAKKILAKTAGCADGG